MTHAQIPSCRRATCFGIALLAIILLSTTFFVGCQTDKSAMSSAAAPATAFVAVSGMEQLLDRLDNLRSSLDGDIKTSLDKGVAGIRSAIADLKELAGENIKAPLDNLGHDAQQLARSLSDATTRIDQMLKSQQKDFFANLSSTVAGVETIGLEFARKLPFGKESAPRVQYFAFAGEIPSVVPVSGGRMEIFGYRLGEVSANKEIAILDAKLEKVLARMKAMPGRGPHSVTVFVEPSFITAQAGQVLGIRIRPNSRNTNSDLLLPMVIPQNLNVSVQVEAGVAYTCTKPVREAFGDWKEKRFRNGSCEKEMQVSETLVWDLPQGYQIVEPIVEPVKEVYRAERVKVTVIGRDKISVAGTITRANCDHTPFGNHLDRESLWHCKVRARIERIVESNQEKQAISEVRALTGNQFVLNVDVPKACEDSAARMSPSSSFWFLATVLIDGKRFGEQFKSPRIQSGERGATSETYSHQGLTLRAQYNPQPVAGKAQVSVTIAKAAK